MPFEFSNDIDRVRTVIDRMIDQYPAAKRRGLNAVGVVVLGLEKQHFQQLSKTGSSNGVMWPHMDADTLARRKALQRMGKLAAADPEQLGVLTGALARGFRYRVKDDRVELRNVDPKANLFNARRPLFPVSVPARWAASSDVILQRSLNRFSKGVSQ